MCVRIQAVGHGLVTYLSLARRAKGSGSRGYGIGFGVRGSGEGLSNLGCCKCLKK